MGDYITGGVMYTIEKETDKHNEKCAEAIRTLKLFIRNAEEQHETKIPISTLKLVLGSIEEGRYEP